MNKRVVAILIVVLAVLAFVAARQYNRGRETPPTSRLDEMKATLEAHRERVDAAADSVMPGWFATAGAPARRIAGIVMRDGQPVAGATVTLHPIVARSATGVPAVRTSDAGGRFDFGTRPAGWFDVVASAPETVAAIAHVTLADPDATPAPDALVLTLTNCTTSVSGTVRDAAGGPIARARIARDGIAGTEAGDDGHYRLCVPAGPVVLTYSADGYGTVSLSMTAALRTRRDVVLVPEAMVTGVVVDEAARPVAGAYVAVNPAEWGPERPATRNAIAGADGRFRIAGVVPGKLRVWGYADGLVTESGGQEVLAEVGASVDIMVRLLARPSVSGHVMRAGAPVAGAKVTAVRTSPPARSWSAFSQADGSFVLERVPPGTLAIQAAPYRVTAPLAIEVGRAAVTGVVIEVEPTAAIRGRVTRRGVPVEGADVCCVPRDGGNRATTGADGAYAFEGVAAGTYQITAASETAGAFVEAVAVTVTATEDRRLDLELASGAAIAGTVVDDKGAPLPAMHVRYIQPNGDLCRTITDEAGRYRCASMTGGAVYVASVFEGPNSQRALQAAPGAPYPAIELAGGASEIEGVTIKVVHHRATIHGRVVDGSGAPVVDARVRANGQPQFSSWLQLPMAITDSDGAFAIGELADDAYALEARTPDGGTGGVLAARPGGPPVTITLVQPGSIVGALTGYPAPPVIYAMSVAVGSSQVSGMVTGDRYRIAGLAPGRYLVDAQTTFEGAARVVEVRAGETTTLDLAAQGRGAIEATVVDADSQAPVPNVVCHVVLAANGMQGLTNWDSTVAPKSDAAGRLRLDPAPAGDVIVSCFSPDPRHSSPSVAVTVTAGATAKVALKSVTSTTDNPGTTGIQFEWRMVAPLIAQIVAGSSAAEAGLEPGDLVTAVGARGVGGLDAAAVRYLIQNHPLGSRVSITVSRAGQPLTVEVELRPSR